MDLQQLLKSRQSRRSVLNKLGRLAGAGLALNVRMFNTGYFDAPAPAPEGNPIRHISILLASDQYVSDGIAPEGNPIRHILIACQENRTFDEYYGIYPRAGSFGLPRGYAQPDGHGGKIYPYQFPLLFQAIFLIPGKIYTVSGIMEQWTAFIRRMAVTPWGIMEAQPSPTTTPWPTLSPCVATISVLRLVQATPTVLFSGRVHVVESRGTRAIAQPWIGQPSWIC